MPYIVHVIMHRLNKLCTVDSAEPVHPQCLVILNCPQALRVYSVVCRNVSDSSCET